MYTSINVVNCTLYTEEMYIIAKFIWNQRMACSYGQFFSVSHEKPNNRIILDRLCGFNTFCLNQTECNKKPKDWLMACQLQAWQENGFHITHKNFLIQDLSYIHRKHMALHQYWQRKKSTAVFNAMSLKALWFHYKIFILLPIAKLDWSPFPWC